MDSKKKDKEQYQSRSEFNDFIQEGMLVTSMIYMPETIGEVIKIIPNSQVFQSDSIRAIFDSICELYRDNLEVKKISVIQKMNVSGRIQSIKNSGLSLNFDINTPSTVEQILLTAESLVSLYRRQIAYDLTLNLNSSLMGDLSDSDLAEKVYNVYEALTIQGGKSLEKTSKDAAYAAIYQISEAMRLRRSGKLSGVPTGSAKLDKHLGGWQNDELILLGGRPGSGKTACGLDFAVGAAEQGYPVGIFSIEMDSEKLNYRIASSKTAIPYSRMIMGDLEDWEFTRIENSLCEIAKLPIYYYDDASISNVSKLETVAVEWCRKRGVKLIIIDYIQYLQVNPKLATFEQITAVSKAVKTMQRRLKIPIIALAQLSRKVEDRSDPTPQMEDLRESGQLEQDASRIIGLLNADYYARKEKPVFDKNGQPLPEFTYRYVILKDRSGNNKNIDRYCDIATNRFSDFASSFDGSQPERFQQLDNKVFNSIPSTFQ